MKRFTLTVATLALFLSPKGVSAHSALERSEPRSGALLSAAPNELRMWFSEPIRVALSTIEVRGAGGKEVDKKNLHSDEKEKALVRLPLVKDLPPGRYRVIWTAVAQDMHPSKGEFFFQVSPK